MISPKFHVIHWVIHQIIYIWLVVWNIFYFSIYWEESSQLTVIFFRGVAQPPTRYDIYDMTWYDIHGYPIFLAISASHQSFFFWGHDDGELHPGVSRGLGEVKKTAGKTDGNPMENGEIVGWKAAKSIKIPWKIPWKNPMKNASTSRQPPDFHSDTTWEKQHEKKGFQNWFVDSGFYGWTPSRSRRWV